MTQQQYEQQGAAQEWHETEGNKMQVYKAINAVQADLSTIGITKARTNTQGAGYQFRGIDDVYNTIAPLLSKHGLCILPRVLTRHCDERTSKNGGALFYVTVEVEFDFVSASDGSKHTVKTFGEAMDSGDKATNKAMSAAYKYAAFQAFSIPTEGDNDADAHTHNVAARADQRMNWLADQQAAIEAAATTGEFKRIVSDALAAAEVEKDQAAIDLIHKWAELKIAKAKKPVKETA